MVVASGPNHAPHLILALLTCGLWLPVWITVALVGRRVEIIGGDRTRRNTRQPVHPLAIVAGLFTLPFVISAVAMKDLTIMLVPAFFIGIGVAVMLV